MTKPFNELRKSATYKLTGNGNRSIGLLMESFNQVSPSLDADVYGTGSIINDFEKEMSDFLGKETAVFFPSGTMAQQIALRIWSDEKNLKKVAYHPLCHLEIHEQDGLKKLHNLEPILLGEKDRLFTIEDLKSINTPISCLLIELPQREIGGQLPSWNELVEISLYCKENNIKLHLDGARLFEVLPYYNKSANEICSLFDSVYVSFYKGLGGIAGAILAGNSVFTYDAKIWKRRHGGDLISLYPYIINAKYSMDNRIGKMKEYWESAITVAEILNKIDGITTIPKVPVCNMFHGFFNAPIERVESVFAEIIEKYDVCLIANIHVVDNLTFRSEFSFGDSFSMIPQKVLNEAFALLESEFRNL